MTMSYGVRIFAVFSAISLIGLAVRAAQDDSRKEPGAKDLFMHPRQLPYHASEDDKSGKGETKGNIGKNGRKGKAGRKGGTDAKPPEPAIGVKYWIMKRSEDGGTSPVAPDAEFHTGDRIQVKFETNYDGYLYIVNFGPSGKPEKMFPSPEIHSGSNRISAGSQLTLPVEDYFMKFEEPAGTENLRVLFSRKPEPNYMSVITSQSERDMISRDLRIEKAPPVAPGEPKDNAAYYVNPTGKPDARVIVEVPLVHK